MPHTKSRSNIHFRKHTENSVFSWNHQYNCTFSVRTALAVPFANLQVLTPTVLFSNSLNLAKATNNRLKFFLKCTHTVRLITAVHNSSIIPFTFRHYSVQVFQLYFLFCYFSKDASQAAPTQCQYAYTHWLLNKGCQRPTIFHTFFNTSHSFHSLSTCAIKKRLHSSRKLDLSSGILT
jgi:hypothetical protein